MQDRQLTPPAVERELTLEDGTQLSYVVQGEGENVIVLLGPGTLLMNFFSAEFKKNTTLIAIDGLWTHEKDSPIDDPHPAAEQFLQDTALAINALRQQVYPNQPFGLAGMSILTKLAMECAQRTNIDFVMLAGVPFLPLSLGFPESDSYFRTQLGALHPMVKAKDDLMRRLASINSAEEGFERLLLPNTNVRDGALTPNSALVENFRIMAPQQSYFDTEYSRMVEFFRCGVTGKVINLSFYAHFFHGIAPLLDEAETALLVLLQAGHRIMVVSGSDDWTTPITVETSATIDAAQFLKDLQAQHPETFQWLHYDKCGHYPMTEQATRDIFDRDIGEFIAQLPEQTRQSSLQAVSMFKTPRSSTVTRDVSQEMQTSTLPQSRL